MPSAIESLRHAVQTQGGKISMAKLAADIKIGQHQLEAFSVGDDLPADKLNLLVEVLFSGHLVLDLQTDSLHPSKKGQPQGVVCEGPLARRGPKRDWRKPERVVLRDLGRKALA